MEWQDTRLSKDRIIPNLVKKLDILDLNIIQIVISEDLEDKAVSTHVEWNLNIYSAEMQTLYWNMQKTLEALEVIYSFFVSYTFRCILKKGFCTRIPQVKNGQINLA